MCYGMAVEASPNRERIALVTENMVVDYSTRTYQQWVGATAVVAADWVLSEFF